MAPISLSTRCLQDLQIIRSFTLEQFQLVCEIALEMLKCQKETRIKRRISKSSVKFECSSNDVERATVAVANLTFEFCKMKLSSSDIKVSLQQVDCAEEHMQLFLKLCLQCEKENETLEFADVGLGYATYNGMDWRAEVVTGRRLSTQHLEPRVTFRVRCSSMNNWDPLLWKTDGTALELLESRLQSAVDEINDTHVDRLIRYLHY